MYVIFILLIIIRELYPKALTGKISKKIVLFHIFSCNDGR